jgi:PPK2 family polyphosphate:nucleotide phosphotransferase
MKDLTSLITPYRVEKGRGFRLKDIDPQDAGPFGGGFKEDAPEALRLCVARLAELQDKLYAQDRWALLIVIQALDAAGKDSLIKNVMSGINPQGCQVAAFKSPSAEELDHDYLWRIWRHLPERGRIGIFNRSHYEEVLAVRVEPELLALQKLPARVVTRRIWQERFEDIRAFERYLTRNGTLVRKFFLYVSRDEQKKRLLERLDRPEKNWKFEAADLEKRRHWKMYMAAYEDAVRETASPEAPWFVVPADRKWFTRLVVGAAIIEALESLDLEYPRVTAKQRQGIVAARNALARGNA